MRHLAGSEKSRAFFVLFVLALAGLMAGLFGNVAPVAAQGAQPKTKVNPTDGLTYVFIAPGSFQMGCSANDKDCTDYEKPAHQVTITQGFWIGQTPVTQVAYKKVMGNNPSIFVGDQLPVEQVSWANASAYCGKVGMRLPTEAEYEFAARAGNAGPRYGAVDTIAWYSANNGLRLHPVAQKQANAYGLYDMLGDVWEWVSDWNGKYTAAAATDPKGPAEGRAHVLRGGSRTTVDSALRVSNRTWMVDGQRDDIDYGFRCAGN